MIGTASLSLSLDRANEQVERMIFQGTAFARVEEAINDASLSQHHKAALWLLAWSLRDPVVQRRDARQMAGVFAADSHAGERLRVLSDQGSGRRASDFDSPTRA
jgi:hypothetical protein